MDETTQTARTRGAAIALLLAAAGAVLVALGAKFWLIQQFGSNTPYWDQWDAQADRLYGPWLQGRFDPGVLLEGHNEHRILLTRLLALLLLQANGLWSPILEMVVNAGLHVLAVGAVVWVAAPALPVAAAAAVGALALAWLVVPFGWENTLAGFQSQFYFLLLFSVLAIRALVLHRPGSARWWAGVLLLVLACFSLASGIVAGAAAALVLLARNLRRGPADRADLLGALLLLALVVVGYKTTPVIAQHAPLRAQDLAQFTDALLRALAWPGDSVLEAIVRNLPGLALLAWLLWRQPPAQDRRWVLAGLVLWVLAQAASLAYGRASDVLASRYRDLLAIAIVVHGAAALVLAHGAARAAARWRVPAWLLAAAWLALAGWGAWHLLRDGQVGAEVNAKRTMAARQEANLLAYLQDGDRARFVRQPVYSLPYPIGERLAAVLDAPGIRAILPGNLQTGLVPAQVRSQGYAEGAVPPGQPPCGCAPWGSHGAPSTGTPHRLEWQFTPAPGLPVTGRIALLVAGTGTLAVVQDGHTTPVQLPPASPGWQAVLVPVGHGPYALVAQDGGEGRWFAIGRPVPVGRWDAAVQALLERWDWLVRAGLVVLALAAVAAVLARRGQRAAA